MDENEASAEDAPPNADATTPEAPPAADAPTSEAPASETSPETQPEAMSNLDQPETLDMTEETAAEEVTVSVAEESKEAETTEPSAPIEQAPPPPPREVPSSQLRKSSSVRLSKQVSIMASTSSRTLPQVAASGMSRTKGLALGSIISFKKSSTLDLMEKGKLARYMNSYKLWADNQFNHEAVQKILKQVVDDTIDNLIYDPDKVPKLVKWTSGVLRAKVKELGFDRYKLVCVLTIGEKRSQDMLTYVRFLWDLERDRFAYYSAENPSVFILAMCFGLYFE